MRGLTRVAVVIPAHNEAAVRPACVRSVVAAANRLPVPVQVVVVLDACDDGRAELAGRFGREVDVVEIDARNVGAAPAAGFEYVRSVGAVPDSRCWCASTDADCRVDPDWLQRQVSVEADVVLGVVRVPVCAIGVAACWLGAARAVAAPLDEAGATGSADAHVLAHLGAVDAAIAAAEAILAATADRVDADPTDSADEAERLARRTRAVVEIAVDEAINRTGRARGPGPLALNARHASLVADLMVYVRQSHAERDVARLGQLAGERR